MGTSAAVRSVLHCSPTMGEATEYDPTSTEVPIAKAHPRIKYLNEILDSERVYASQLRDIVEVSGWGMWKVCGCGMLRSSVFSYEGNIGRRVMTFGLEVLVS